VERKKKNKLFDDNDLIHAEVADDLLETMDEEIAKLEKQLIEKDEELAQIYSHLGVEAYLDQQKQALKEIDKLKKKATTKYKQQLAEKDKEIEKLKEENRELINGAKQMLYEGKEIMQSIRHQVCEEIREEAYFDHYKDVDGSIQVVYCIESEKLKAIEGENECQ